MTTSDKVRLTALMKKFNAMNGDIQGFHKIWKPFMNTLSKEDAEDATQVMFDTILDNAKKFREESIRYAENGGEHERQVVAEMVDELKEHPFFTRERLAL
jgi:hypothetical protein